MQHRITATHKLDVWSPDLSRNLVNFAPEQSRLRPDPIAFSRSRRIPVSSLLFLPLSLLHGLGIAVLYPPRIPTFSVPLACFLRRRKTSTLSIRD